MIILKNFTVGDAVLACHMLRAIAEKSPSPTAAQALRELAESLMTGADAEVSPDNLGADEGGELEDASIAASIDWARAEVASNKAADELAVAVRAQENRTGGSAAVRIERGVMRIEPPDPRSPQDVLEGSRQVDLLIRVLDMAADAEQSAMRRMRQAALDLLGEDKTTTEAAKAEPQERSN